MREVEIWVLCSWTVPSCRSFEPAAGPSSLHPFFHYPSPLLPIDPLWPFLAIDHFQSRASCCAHPNFTETSMAAVQLHRSLTETRTIIDQKQSLEVVQTMLHGGVSTPPTFTRHELY